jgi:hypothetical protein
LLVCLRDSERGNRTSAARFSDTDYFILLSGQITLRVDRDGPIGSRPIARSSVEVMTRGSIAEIRTRFLAAGPSGF